MSQSSGILKPVPSANALHSHQILIQQGTFGVHLMNVPLTYLQHLCDAFMSAWTNVSHECFQHLVERINAALTANIVHTPTSH